MVDIISLDQTKKPFQKFITTVLLPAPLILPELSMTHVNAGFKRFKNYCRTPNRFSVADNNKNKKNLTSPMSLVTTSFGWSSLTFQILTVLFSEAVKRSSGTVGHKARPETKYCSSKTSNKK